MRVLMLEWDAFCQEYIADEMKKLGCEVESYCWPYGEQNMRENPELQEHLIEYLKKRNYHFVFSINFFPVAAAACYYMGIRYISWIYDSPYLLLYSKHIQYQTNQIYVFDSSLYNELREKVDNVYYLPMAAPVEYYDSLKENAESENYKADVSFVGSTYKESRQDFFRYLENTNAYTKGYLNAIMKAQKEVYNYFFLEEILPEYVLEELQRVCPIQKGEDEWESDAWIYANYFLARKMTGEQRVELLSKLAKEYQVKVYAPEKMTELEKAQQCGPVDYMTQMPYIFQNSKINLNMTLRSIHTGIPLRAMDIMGCGGFLLTNYQEDFLKYFEPGVDYVYYESNEDLLQKVEYYLSHEEERKQIARNGYEKVKAAHTYAHRIKLILENCMSPMEIELNNAINEYEDICERLGGEWYPDVEKDSYKNLSSEELLEDTEKRLNWLGQIEEVSFKMANILEVLINEALQTANEKSYDKLLCYFNKEVINKLAIINYRVYEYNYWIYIYLWEKENNLPYSFSNFKTAEELHIAFQCMKSLLIRLYYDFDDENKKEIFYYMQEKNLGFQVISMFLELPRMVYRKEQILEELKRLEESGDI